MRRKIRGNYGYAVGIILLCAVFVCMGQEMMTQDAGTLQLYTWSETDENFRLFRLTEHVSEKLEQLSKITGQNKEKLLAALMLKYHFTPPETFSGPQLLADMLGYENLGNQRFDALSEYCRRLLNAVEYQPAAEVRWTEGQKVCGMDKLELLEEEDYTVRLQCEQQKDTCFPVVNMMTGEIVSIQIKEIKKDTDGSKDIFVSDTAAKSNDIFISNTAAKRKDQQIDDSAAKENKKYAGDEDAIVSICIESQEGIRVQYENMDFLRKEWQTGEPVRAGEVMGFSKKEGMKLRFWLQGRDGSWYPFQGKSCILCGGQKSCRILERSEN